MGTVRGYDPEFASSQIGTPGIDQSAGDAQTRLAEGTSGLRQSQAQVSANNSGLLADIIGGAVNLSAHALSGLIQNHQANVAKEESMLANLGVTKDGNDFSSFADAAFLNGQKEHINDPENLPAVLQKSLDQEKKARLAKYKDPVLKAKAQNDFEQHANSVNNQAKHWARDRQTQQAHVMIPNIVTRSQGLIAQQTGFIEERKNLFDNEARRLFETAEKSRDVLGDEVLDAQLMKGYQDLSNGFMQNMITKRPEAPTAALSWLNATKKYLADPNSNGLQLSETDMKELTSAVHRAEEFEQTKLTADMALKQVSDKNTAKTLEMQAKSAPEADLLEIEKLANNKIAESELQFLNVEKDPTLLDKAKRTVLSGLVAEKAEYQAVIGAIKSRRNEFEKEAKEQQRATEKEAKEQERANQQAYSQKMSVNAAERGALQSQVTLERLVENQRAEKAKLDSQAEIDTERDALGQLMVGSPEQLFSRRKDMIERAAKISVLAHAKADNGEISQTQALSISKEMEGHMKTLALMHKDQFGVFSGFGQYKTTAEPLNLVSDSIGKMFGKEPEYVKAREAQAAILVEMNKAAEKMRLQKDYASLTVDRGFSNEQKVIWNEKVSELQTQNLSPKQFEYKLQRLHAAIAGEAKSFQLQKQIDALQQERLEMVKSKTTKVQNSEAKLPASSKLVPPPPAVPAPPSAAVRKMSRQEAMALYGIEVID